MNVLTMLARRRANRRTPDRPARPGRAAPVEALERRQYLLTSTITTPISPPSPLAFLAVAGGQLYFQDYVSPHRRQFVENVTYTSDLHGGLWRSDGTSTGTRFITDDRIEYQGSPPVVLDSQRVLVPDSWGHRFSVIDGNSGAVTHFEPPGEFGKIGPMVSLGAYALFTVFKAASYGSPANGTLWRTDGTEEGTTLVRDLGAVEVTEMVAPAGNGVAHMIVRVLPPEGYGESETMWATWRSDGTADGTTPVLDLVRRQAFGLVPAGGGEVSFLAHATGTSISQTDRWLSDGTAGGSRVVESFNPGTYWFASENSPHRLAYGRAVFSTRSNASTLTELTINGEIVDINPGGAGSDPANFFVSSDGTLYFTADDGVHGRELWASDGTADGTRMVADLAPGEADAQPYGARFAELNGSIYFTVDQDYRTRHLYRLTGGVAERLSYVDARFSVKAVANQAMAPAARFDVVSTHSPSQSYDPATDPSLIPPSEFERDPGAVRVIGPDGSEQPVHLVGLVPTRKSWPGYATFAFADGQRVSASDNGVYTVEMLGGRVRNFAGEFAANAVLGTFELNTPADGPDLVASLAVVGKAITSAAAGQKVRVSVRVENRGNAPAHGPFYVGLSAVPAEAPQEVGWRTGGLPVKVKSLAPGRSKTVKGFAILPPYGPDGTRVLRATVDLNHVLAETDESNNSGDGPAFPFVRWTQPLRVDVAPDLGTLTLNDTHTVPVRIENVSGRPFSGDLRLSLVESGEADNPSAFYASQPLVRRVDLAPGASVTVDYAFYQTENLLDPGPRTLRFQVDSLKPVGAGGEATAAVVMVWP